MFSIWLALSIVLLSIVNNLASNLRCNEDINGSLQVIENCRACVIFIAPATIYPPTSTTTTTTTTTTSSSTSSTSIFPRQLYASNAEPTIEELFLFDEKKRRRRRRRQYVDTVIHQQCARELVGPLYGYDQTHCYCNSNQCNSNIQRCIYEVTSKRHFACYHGTNSTQYPLEIRHKCRSCRIRMEMNSMYHYECLTFGEREQINDTHCTCQRPMCNQDVSTCQRSQQAPSQPRTHLTHNILINFTSLLSSPPTTTTTTTTTTTKKTTKTTTTTTTTTTSTSSSTTTIPTTITMKTTMISFTTTHPIRTTTIVSGTQSNTTEILSTLIETNENTLIENTTLIQLTTVNDTTTSFMEIKHLKTVEIELKSSSNYLSSNYLLSFTLLQLFLFLLIYSM